MPGNNLNSKISAPSAFKRALNSIKKQRNFIKVGDGEGSEREESGERKPGIVYLGHIPKGFHEVEMRKYFSQFGRVKRIKLARSKKTGQSKGYAFIEFAYYEVAKVVAETMNNYLMFNRLLKASIVDKEYPRHFWWRVSRTLYPAVKNRSKDRTHKNRAVDAEQELKLVIKQKKTLENTLQKLKEKGVDYVFEPEDDITETLKASVNENSKTERESSSSDESCHIFEIDESDSEIEFKTPPNAIKQALKHKVSDDKDLPLKIQKIIKKSKSHK